MSANRCARLLPVLASALALSALAGCRPAGALAETATPARPPAALAPQPEPALRTGRSLPLPQDFPNDVYLPARYDVRSVLDMDGARVLSLHAPGRVGDLFADARNAMTHLGWQQTMAVEHAADSAVLAFEKGPRATVLSFGSDRGEGVTVNVQLHERL